MDERGKLLIDYIAPLDHVILNTGKTPICVRHKRSFDVILAIAALGLALQIKDRQVPEE